MPENKTNNENQARMLSGKPPIGMPEREGGYAPHEYMDRPTEVPFETKRARKLIMGGFDERQIAVRGFVFSKWFGIAVLLFFITALLYGNNKMQLVSLTGMICAACTLYFGCFLELSLRGAMMPFDIHRELSIVVANITGSIFTYAATLFSQFVLKTGQILSEKKTLAMPFDIVFAVIAVVLMVIYYIAIISGYFKHKKQSKLSE